MKRNDEYRSELFKAWLDVGGSPLLKQILVTEMRQAASDFYEERQRRGEKW
jgi:hypothetical protein